MSLMSSSELLFPMFFGQDRILFLMLFTNKEVTAFELIDVPSVTDIEMTKLTKQCMPANY